MPPVQLPNDQIAIDTPVFDDAAGRPTAPPPGAVITFTPGDPAIATLVVGADGKSATITPVAAQGAFTYTVSAGRPDGTQIPGYTQELDIVAGAAAALVPNLSLSARA